MALRYPAPLPTLSPMLPSRGGRFAPAGWPISSGMVAGLLRNMHQLEVLGEKALAEGHIDILIKEAIPMGLARKIIIEVKTGLAKLQDVNQLSMYLDETGNECLAGVLIARYFSRKVLQEAKRQGISTFEYNLGEIESGVPVTFQELKQDIQLTRIT